MNKNKLPVPAAALLLAALLFAVLLLQGCSEPQEVTEGIQYIKSMENADLASVEKEVDQVRQSLFFEELDERIEEDPDYVWTALDQIGTVMMGDSRTVPYATYGFMDESRVLAEGGKTIWGMEDHFEELWAIHPNLVVLAYGLNDIHWSYDYPEAFADQVMEYVDIIQEHLPDAYIYIQSILVPRERMEEIYDMPNRAADCACWNEVMMPIFEERGYRTIDVSDIVENNTEYFGEDGCHFYAPFYPLLAERILKTYLKDSMVFDD